MSLPRPRIAPPTPNFPTKFSAPVPEAAPPANPWPEQESALNGSQSAVEWKLKDDKEVYIASLEDRLKNLTDTSMRPNSSSSAGSHTSKPDSGYHSHPAFSPIQNAVDPAMYDQDEGSDYEGRDEDLDEDGGREGHALLKNVVPPATTSTTTLLQSAQESEQQSTTPPEASGSRFTVIPPTPSSQEEVLRDVISDDEEDDGGDDDAGLVYRMPSQVPDQVLNQQQRISFSGSVRISGGIKSGKPSKRKRKPIPPNATDLFSPVSTASSAFDSDFNRSRRVPSTSSLSSSRQGSRSASPSSSGFEINTRNPSSGSLSYVQHHSGYSSGATTSGIQSRSSSPCSSIYAPLQPPSKVCPSPMNVRPLKVGNSSGGISFRDYLKGKGMENSYGDESEEEVVRGYRELVEEQRRKRAKFDRQRRGHRSKNGMGSNNARERSKSPGVWSRIKEIFKSGGAVSSLGSGGARGGMSGGLYGATGATPAWGFNEEQGLGASPVGISRGRSRTRGVRRSPSNLAISVLSDDDDATGGSPSNPNTEETIKTPMDVMFGPSPNRWLKLDWWIYRTKLLWRSVDCLGLTRQEKEENAATSAAV